MSDKHRLSSKPMMSVIYKMGWFVFIFIGLIFFMQIVIAIEDPHGGGRSGNMARSGVTVEQVYTEGAVSAMIGLMMLGLACFFTPNRVEWLLTYKRGDERLIN